MKSNQVSEQRTTKPFRKTGKVVENCRYKEGTITVMVKKPKHLKKYHRTFYHQKKFVVHYHNKEIIPINTTVEIEACRKISKKKNFKVISIAGQAVKRLKEKNNAQRN